MDKDRTYITERYLKRSYFIAGQYKLYLKNKTQHIEDDIYVKWVNLIQIALMFYGLSAIGKLGYSQRKYHARREVERFEEKHRVSTGIFETAERMFL